MVFSEFGSHCDAAECFITVLNMELKILAHFLANSLQLVISDLIGPEQNYAVKGRSIQDNLHKNG